MSESTTNAHYAHLESAIALARLLELVARSGLTRTSTRP